MKIPNDASADVQEAFKEVWRILDQLTLKEVDFKGRRITNLGQPVQPSDVATKAYVDSKIKR